MSSTMSSTAPKLKDKTIAGQCIRFFLANPDGKLTTLQIFEKFADAVIHGYDGRIVDHLLTAPVDDHLLKRLGDEKHGYVYTAGDALTHQLPSTTTGTKHDASKPRWSLLPRGTVAMIVNVLEKGAVKYAPDNWKHVPSARTRYYDAMLRHVEAWWLGQKLDPETQLPHLAHAACCLLFLLWLEDNQGPTP